MLNMTLHKGPDPDNGEQIIYCTLQYNRVSHAAPQCHSVLPNWHVLQQRSPCSWEKYSATCSCLAAGAPTLLLP